MTKSQQIMSLYDGKRTTREIAEIVGCDPAYVRVVARQRKNGRGDSPAQLRWRSTPRGRALRAAARRRWYERKVAASC